MSKADDFNISHLHLARVEVIKFKFRHACVYVESLGYNAELFATLRDPSFNRFSRTPTCGGQTDAWTDRRTHDNSIY